MQTIGTERKSISQLAKHLQISSRLEVDSCFIFKLMTQKLAQKKRHALIKFADGLSWKAPSPEEASEAVVEEELDRWLCAAVMELG